MKKISGSCGISYEDETDPSGNRRRRVEVEPVETGMIVGAITAGTLAVIGAPVAAIVATGTVVGTIAASVVSSGDKKDTKSGDKKRKPHKKKKPTNSQKNNLKSKTN